MRDLGGVPKEGEGGHEARDILRARDVIPFENLRLMTLRSEREPYSSPYTP